MGKERKRSGLNKLSAKLCRRGMSKMIVIDRRLCITNGTNGRWTFWIPLVMPLFDTNNFDLDCLKMFVKFHSSVASVNFRGTGHIGENSPKGCLGETLVFCLSKKL